jgi:hypothetical protein
MQSPLRSSTLKLAGEGRLWQMAPKSVDARITLGQKLAVEVQELTLGPAPETLAAPPFSVNIYSYKVQ